MIEKIKIPEDMDAIAREVSKDITPEQSYYTTQDYNNVIIRASIEMLSEKINEIIDVINSPPVPELRLVKKNNDIEINAVDAKAFDEMIRNNPGCLVQYFGDPPDEVA